MFTLHYAYANKCKMLLGSKRVTPLRPRRHRINAWRNYVERKHQK